MCYLKRTPATLSSDGATKRKRTCGLNADCAQTAKCVYFAEKVHKVLQIPAKFYGNLH
jgi:hypothetical protein